MWELNRSGLMNCLKTSFEVVFCFLFLKIVLIVIQVVWRTLMVCTGDVSGISARVSVLVSGVVDNGGVVVANPFFCHQRWLSVEL